MSVDPYDSATADLIAENLGSLPFPGDGKEPPKLLFLPGYRQHGQPTHMIEMMRQHGRQVGLSIVNLLRMNGKAVVDANHHAQLTQAVAATPPKEAITVQVVCNLCSNVIIGAMRLSTERPSVNGPHFLAQMQKLHPECEYGHKPIEAS